MPEQRNAVDFIVQQGSVALFAQQRTGKTWITMAVLERLSWPTALIVAPLTSLELVWVPALVDSHYTLCRSLEEAREASGPVVLLMHYQLFEKASKKLAKHPWAMVVIDESQGLKARNSKQSRAARRLRHVPRRLALSGTPIDESEMDVWAQMRFVNHAVLGENWTDFAHEYCYQSGWMGREWKFNKRKHQQFLDILRPHIFRLTVDFLKLKPMELHPIPVMMLGQQAQLYDQMKKEGVIRVGNAVITAPLEVTKQVKLAQITGGAVLDEDDVPRPVGQAKERKLRWLIGRLAPPVVVFCHYRHEMPIVVRVLKGFFPRVKELHGDVRDTRRSKDRTELVRSFQAGELDALVCQVRTGGVAIDLTSSSQLVFYSMNYSYIDFEQILFRLYGIKQTKILHAYFLYVADTVDEEKIDLIQNKKSAAYRIMSPFVRSTA